MPNAWSACRTDKHPRHHDWCRNPLPSPPPPNSPPPHYWGADTAPWAPCLDTRIQLPSRTSVCPQQKHCCHSRHDCLCCLWHDCLFCGIEGYGQHSVIHVHCTHIKHKTIPSSHVRDSITAKRHAAAANASNGQGPLLMWHEGSMEPHTTRQLIWR